MPSQARNYSLDLLKAFAIFCVVWGHSIQYFGRSSWFFDNPVFAFIYSFHMPLFMFISGYFSLSAFKRKPIDFFRHKFMQLLLPCLSWGLIMYFSLELMGRNSQLSFEGLLSSYWFLTACFLSYALIYLLRLATKSLWVTVIISLLLSRLPWVGFYFSFMFPFFLFGYIVALYKDRISGFLPQISIVSGLLFIVSLFFWTADYTVYQSPSILLTIQTLHAGNFYSQLGTDLFRFLIGISGTLFCFALFSQIHLQRVSTSKVLQGLVWVGRNTLGIYAVQGLFFSLFQIKEGFYVDLLQYFDLYTFSLLMSPMVAIVVILVVMFLIYILLMNRISSMVLLGRMPIPERSADSKTL